jgi:thermitase
MHRYLHPLKPFIATSLLVAALVACSTPTPQITSEPGPVESALDSQGAGLQMTAMGLNTWATGMNTWSSGNVNSWATGMNTWSSGMNTWSSGMNTWSSGNISYGPIPSNTNNWKSIKLDLAQQRLSKLGAGVKVAVIDTGIDLKHPAFTNSLVASNEMKDFIDGDSNPQDVGKGGQAGFGHGSEVASIVLQIAPLAKIMPLRALNADGTGDAKKVLDAVKFAIAKGAQIVNLSIGMNWAAADLIPVFEAAANLKGVLIVRAAGNTGTSQPTMSVADPATVITVGSVNTLGQKSGFSAYGQYTDISAPGENIYGAFPSSQTIAWSGTSMSTPVVSGALALVLSENPALYGTDMLPLRNKLLASANAGIYQVATNLTYKGQLGAGMLDLDAFVKTALGL